MLSIGHPLDVFSRLDTWISGISKASQSKGPPLRWFTGDGTLCVFPGGAEGDAIQCGFDMRAAYVDIVREWNIIHDTELEVGIAAGEVEVGLIGHRSLRKKEIVGEPAFRASRIGHHRGIAIAERVYQAVKDDYPTRRLDDMRQQLHDKPLKVWEVIQP